MKIAVLGCGAMGMLIGGYLSQHNEVYLVDIDKERVDAVNRGGISIAQPDGSSLLVHPHAVVETAEVGAADLVIIFVKSMYSQAALTANKTLFGENTYLMTLQNGAGHDEVMRQFVSPEHVVIGTTKHNSSISGMHEISHGASGITCIGSIADCNEKLQPIADAFSACGLETVVEENIQKLIWAKLFVNSSISALTGALQVPIGFMADCAAATEMMQTLVREAVTVANAQGLDFSEEAVQKSVYDLAKSSPNGLTSIYADLRDGRKTEVDTISGAVVRAGIQTGTPTPSHAFLVQMIHAMETRNANKVK